MRSPLELMLRLITHPACVHAEMQHAAASATRLVIVAIQFDQVEGVEEYPFIMVAIANEIE